MQNHNIQRPIPLTKKHCNKRHYYTGEKGSVSELELGFLVSQNGTLNGYQGHSIYQLLQITI